MLVDLIPKGTVQGMLWEMVQGVVLEHNDLKQHKTKQKESNETEETKSIQKEQCGDNVVKGTMWGTVQGMLQEMVQGMVLEHNDLKQHKIEAKGIKRN